MNEKIFETIKNVSLNKSVVISNIVGIINKILKESFNSYGFITMHILRSANFNCDYINADSDAKISAISDNNQVA